LTGAFTGSIAILYNDNWDTTARRRERKPL